MTASASTTAAAATLNSIVSTVGNSLNSVIAKLTPAATALDRIYVRQQIALGVGNLLEAAISFAVVVVGVLLLRWAFRNGPEYASSYDGGWQDQHVAGVIGGVLAVGLGLVIGGACLTYGVLHLISPQFYALQSLLSTVTGGGGS